ncbi:MAG: hypothetical protein E7667_01815 [Ruminococcaceae bacterium]|nr:hypothetical protein [Oscillospiraceae bacterium]
MLCEKCKNKTPTVFFTDTEGTNHSLCALCASAGSSVSASLSQNENSPKTIFSPALSIHSHEKPFWYIPDCDRKSSCPSCKTPYSEMHETGMFGCPICAVKILLSRSDSAMRMPRRIRAEIDKAKSLDHLNQMLAQAIAVQDYEKAISVRDEIKSLENKKIS